MAKCEHCGNEYDKTFEVTFKGKTHVFDSFECAIHVIAPECDHCRCKIIGHVNKRSAMWLPTFLQRGIHFFGERTEVLAFNNFVLFDRVHLPIIGKRATAF